MPTEILASEAAPTHLLILIPGIRDVGAWKADLERVVAPLRIKTAGAHNGFFGLVGFLWPFGWARRRAMEQVEQHIRAALAANPSIKRVSIIAHSFGSYMAVTILDTRTDLFRGDQKLEQVILCGSVMPRQFDFERIRQRIGGRFVNDAGSCDIWPVVAEALSFIFGSAGTYGFGNGTIVDRHHAKAGHGTYFESGFAEQWWVHVLKGEALQMPPDAGSAQTPFFFRFITETRHYLATLALISLVAWLGLVQLRYYFPMRPVSLSVDDSLPNRLGAAIEAAVDEANRTSPLPREMRWLNGAVLERNFVPVSTRGSFERMDSCTPFTFPGPGDAPHDPYAALRALQAAVPQCIEVDGVGTDELIVTPLTEAWTAYANGSGEDRALCGCSPEQIERITEGD